MTSEMIANGRFQGREFRQDRAVLLWKEKKACFDPLIEVSLVGYRRGFSKFREGISEVGHMGIFKGYFRNFFLYNFVVGLSGKRVHLPPFPPNIHRVSLRRYQLQLKYFLFF